MKYDLGAFEIFLLAVVIGGIFQKLLGFAKAGIIGYYFYYQELEMIELHSVKINNQATLAENAIKNELIVLIRNKKKTAA